MANTIKTGTILIREGALLPESLLIESEPYAPGWRLVKRLDSDGMSQTIGSVSKTPHSRHGLDPPSAIFLRRAVLLDR